MKHLAHLVIEELLRRGETVELFATVSECILPMSIAGEVVVLRIEPNNPTNNQNRNLDDHAFSALLSFNQVPFRVVVPWAAVRAACVDQQGVTFMVIPNEAPAPPPQVPPRLRVVKP